MNLKTTAAVLTFGAFVGVAFAQTNTPRVDAREANQAQRIEQGKATGQLTDKEAAKLSAGQAKVDAKEAAAKSDGVVTKAERAKLTRAQNKQSRKIAKQKHDKQVKPVPAPVQ